MPDENKQLNIPIASAYQMSYLNSIAALTSSVIDLSLFHPWDTIVKRIQNNQKVIPLDYSNSNKLKASAFSLYKGFFAAGILKVAHRTIKYGGEPFVKELLHTTSLPETDPVKLHAVSGGMIGIFEALLTTPLDTLKAKKQSGNFNGSNYLKLWNNDKPYRFKPLPITLLRNGVGTAAFFATDNALRQYVYGVSDNSNLTYTQKMINSALCPSIGIIVSYPADVVKTRIQINPQFLHARKIFKEMIYTKGIKGLYQGLGTKVVTTFPRAWFSYMLFQVIRDELQMDSKNIDKPFEQKKTIK